MCTASPSSRVECASALELVGPRRRLVQRHGASGVRLPTASRTHTTSRAFAGVPVRGACRRRQCADKSPSIGRAARDATSHLERLPNRITMRGDRGADDKGVLALRRLRGSALLQRVAAAGSGAITLLAWQGYSTSARTECSVMWWWVGCMYGAVADVSPDVLDASLLFQSAQGGNKLK
ncbi:hypothetical protein B0H17DRAFT_1139817 [Mycena rosella]|uniref:Uncharacterized protein n=1 Tax=Mycena rosella TaxID=1033263 RepID=A0AAD7D398_MYCRO|nr:hypothetical protein B0H17DRAFT_1139817 [Mycena rosella]